MGKQVNFYMDERDEREFVTFILSDPDARICLHESRDGELEFITNFVDPTVSPSVPLDLWHSAKSPPPIFEHLENQSAYFIDRLQSEVIEFSRCHLDGQTLTRGRLWMEQRKLNSERTELLMKNKAFNQWYQKLANRVRKRGQRNSAGHYVWPGAAEHLAAGGFLDDLTTRPQILREGE